MKAEPCSALLAWSELPRIGIGSNDEAAGWQRQRLRGEHGTVGSRCRRYKWIVVVVRALRGNGHTVGEVHAGADAGGERERRVIGFQVLDAGGGGLVWTLDHKGWRCGRLRTLAEAAMERHGATVQAASAVGRRLGLGGFRGHGWLRLRNVVG
jgi:hypothetical protein